MGEAGQFRTNPEFWSFSRKQADNLYNFLAWVLDGDKADNNHGLHERVCCSSTVKQQIFSIGKDLIFVSRNSRIKPQSTSTLHWLYETLLVFQN